ncbi:MAG: YoaP domain-containing protein [Acetobacter sp.]|nr:YoaP domain-containing protein [Acetobacter sp.]
MFIAPRKTEARKRTISEQPKTTSTFRNGKFVTQEILTDKKFLALAGETE